MRNEPIKDLESLSYALVLLQEICQGYNTVGYRARAVNYLIAGGNMYISNFMTPRWVHKVISTQELIAIIESILKDVYAA